jgi:hypothetical protein
MVEIIVGGRIGDLAGGFIDFAVSTLLGPTQGSVPGHC